MLQTCLALNHIKEKGFSHIQSIRLFLYAFTNLRYCNRRYRWCLSFLKAEVFECLSMFNESIIKLEKQTNKQKKKTYMNVQNSIEKGR